MLWKHPWKCHCIQHSNLSQPRCEMPEGYSSPLIRACKSERLVCFVLFLLMFRLVLLCWADRCHPEKGHLMNMSLCAIKFSLYCQNCLVINTSWVDRKRGMCGDKRLRFGPRDSQDGRIGNRIVSSDMQLLDFWKWKKKNSNRILVGFLGLLCCIHSDTQRPFFTLKQKRQTMTAKIFGEISSKSLRPVFVRRYLWY